MHSDSIFEYYDLPFYIQWFLFPYQQPFVLPNQHLTPYKYLFQKEDSYTRV